MNLDPSRLKELRRIGHHLSPVVIVAGNGLTENVQTEIARALADHELIKVKVMAEERARKRELINNICETAGAELVQTTGHIALIYKANPDADPKLSNIRRYKS